jgi:hypothetical protein
MQPTRRVTLGGTRLIGVVGQTTKTEQLQRGSPLASRAPEGAHDHFVVIVRVIQVAADLR